ncbi:hypothetical protein SLS55_006179 [Diplodia seriata]|uniref:Heterokaryon incompatibility domain-containing protein n=1 Tax=Diplodia seriata TaxID=420778 RepID=A0ABR3CDG7_9PEZI
MCWPQDHEIEVTPDPQDADPEEDLLHRGPLEEIHIPLFERDMPAAQAPFSSEDSKHWQRTLGVHGPLPHDNTKRWAQTLSALPCINRRYFHPWSLKPPARLPDSTTLAACPGAAIRLCFSQYARGVQLRPCGNAACAARRTQLDEVLPPCAWRRLREWLVALLGCTLDLANGETEAKTCPFWVCETRLDKILRDFDEGGGGRDRLWYCIDVVGIRSIFAWVLHTQVDGRFWGFVRDSASRDEQSQAMRVLHHAAAVEAVGEAVGMGICPWRLGNASRLSLRGEVDLPPIVQMVRQKDHLKRALGSEKHGECNTDFCKISKLESTGVQQLHRCRGALCGETEFPQEQLVRSLRTGGPTVWSSGPKYRITGHTSLIDSDKMQESPYVAISHVWSDGTGVGLKTPGTVNRCLFDYFADVSERLSCKGIWWDTICVPEDDDARKTAILRMNSDYENAAFTVVHDASLVNFEWREDGSPCVALFLSDWFTRGWTAIELCISRHVKVLFKDPDFPNGPPLIKDLDKDVLPSAKHLCHLGVRNAQHIITKFREFRHENERPSESNTRSTKIRKSGLINDFKNLTDVIATRTTSRKKDEMVIAGLLGLEELDESLDSAAITKQIIARFAAHIPRSILFHKEPTICSSGPWSWCLSCLYDIVAVGPRRQTTTSDPAALSRGELVLYLRHQILERDDCDYVIPQSDDAGVKISISEALKRWQNCVLLADGGEAGVVSPPAYFLLASVVSAAPDFIMGRQRGGHVVCRFIGTVAFPLERDRWKVGVDTSRGGQALQFRFGSDGDRPEQNARALLEQFDEWFR